MSVTLPELKCGSCGDPAIGVCNCILSQPMSEAYCQRCLTEGIETLPICAGTLYCVLEKPMPRDQAKGVVADWALEIIDRSLEFHKKTWDEVMVMIDWSYPEP